MSYKIRSQTPPAFAAGAGPLGGVLCSLETLTAASGPLSCRHVTRSTHWAPLILHRAVVIGRLRGHESCRRSAVQGKGSTVDT